MKAVTIFLTTLGLMIVLAFATGWVTSVLWNYALVPQGLIKMDALGGVAINLLAGILMGRTALSVKESKS